MENIKCDVVGCEYSSLQGIQASVQIQCFLAVVSWYFTFLLYIHTFQNIFHGLWMGFFTSHPIPVAFFYYK